jgi:NAD(P)H-hydrate epimerase
MEPVVTPAEMAAIDAEAPEPVTELIARAGWATAQAARRLLGSAAGKRVVILAGKGNNGADGRAAVPHLEAAGARCLVVNLEPEPELDRADGDGGLGRLDIDLVIDACYGTGLRRPFDGIGLARSLRLNGVLHPDDPTRPGPVPVLAVDTPSGVDGLTGAVNGRPLPATATVTFAAWKPGLLFRPGRALAGAVTVADIGLDCSRATRFLLGPDDLVRWPVRRPDDHKWRRAVLVVGGSPGMEGAPALAAIGAFRSGAGYVTLARPGAIASSPGSPGATLGGPSEAVHRPIGERWADDLLDVPPGETAGPDGPAEGVGPAARYGAAVIGPGLADTAANRAAVRRWWTEASIPTVVDAGALTTLAAVVPAGTTAPVPAGPRVVTPHDGEFVRLAGHRPGQDRIEAARDLARRLASVVLLKGPTTVIADPGGSVLLSTAGDARLATAGSGDVLAGLVASALAGDCGPLEAAGLAAELHGQAARRGPIVGFTASDLGPLVAEVGSELADGPVRQPDRW